MDDQRISKMIPSIIRASRTADDFRRAMQAKYQHYADRRKFIDEEMAPIFKYLDDLKLGNDGFTIKLQTEELGEKLGRGGFGMVHRYHHKLLEMDFAVKLFEPLFVSNEENLEGEKRFFREAKILFSLNHENIVRIYDIGRYNGQPFIRMELVAGDTMHDFISKYGTVSYKRSIKPILQIENYRQNKSLSYCPHTLLNIGRRSSLRRPFHFIHTLIFSNPLNNFSASLYSTARLANRLDSTVAPQIP